MPRRALVSAALAAAALAAPATATADWPLYGHDLANTRNAGAEGPSADQLPSIAQAWRFDASTGDFTGTPAISRGVLVAGNHGGWVYALNAVDGKVLWSKDLGAPINGSAAIDADAPGGPTAFVPVAEPGRPRLVALSLGDGAKRWETVLTGQDNASVYGSPTFRDGTIYIGTSGPNNDDTTARGSVLALEEATGRIRWQTFTVPPGRDGAAVWTTPAIDPDTGRLYVGTGNNYHQPTTDTEDAILALDTATGAIVGKYQATANDSFAADNPFGGPDYDFGASPNLFEAADGRKLIGEGQKSGTYWTLDRATLQPVWHTTVGPGGVLGGILGSTAFDGGQIYGADTIDGEVFALGRDGSTAWTSGDSGALHVAATSVAHGVVYTVDPSGLLIARDPKTGAVLTRLSLGGPSFGGVSATGGALYVAVGTGPPPEPAPQQDGAGSIIAFGDTSRSGASTSPAPAPRSTPAAHEPARGAALRLAVRPRRVRAHRSVLLRFHVARGLWPAPDVTVRVGARRVRTGRDGRATLRVRFRGPGRRHVLAGSARAALRVVR
jgi:polyvinyl alcohol dehydrogenase (cytochrome)